MVDRFNVPEEGMEQHANNTEQLGDQISESTLSVLVEDPNSLLLKKFEELPFEKKKEYLHTVFGTVRGRTGFFDFRYTAGTASHGIREIGAGKEAYAFICKDGLYGESGGSTTSNNNIIILMDDKLYRSPKVRYYDDNDKVNAPWLNYKKICKCNYDEAKNGFSMEVEGTNGSTSTIEVIFSGIYEFEEKLLGGLRVPTELLHTEEQQNEKKEEQSPEQKALNQQKMYQKGIDIMILQEQWGAVEKYMKTKEIVLSEVQKQQYIEYLLFGRKRGFGEEMLLEDMKKIVEVLKTMTDSEYVKNIARQTLDKTLGKNQKRIEEVEDAIQEMMGLAEIDVTSRGKKLLDYEIEHNSRYYGNLLEEVDSLIKKYNEDEYYRYTKMLEELREKKDIVRLDNGVMKKIISKIAVVLGKDQEELHKELFHKSIELVKDMSGYDFTYFKETLDEKAYDMQMYELVFDKACTSTYIRPKYHSEKEETVNMLAEMKTLLKKKFPVELFVNMMLIISSSQKPQKHKEIYSLFWKTHIGDYSEQEKEMIIHSLVDAYIKETQGFIPEDLVEWGLCNHEKILQIVEYLLDVKHYVEASDNFVDSLKKYDIIDADLQEKIDNLYMNISAAYLKGKKLESNNWCPYEYEKYAKHASKELVEQYVQRKLESYVGRFGNSDCYGESIFYFVHMTKCLVNAGYTPEDLQTKIVDHINKNECAFAANFIEGLGLNIDKVRVNGLVQQLFAEEKIKEAEKIAIAAGLYDVWEVRLFQKKLEKKMLSFHSATEGIKKLGLDSSYYTYVIDLGLDMKNLIEVFEWADKKNIIISDEQFDRYLGKNERLRKADEERRQKEKEIREAKAIEMMKIVLDGKMSCDIDYQKDQKYILVMHPEQGLKIASYDLEWHKDIASRISIDGKYVMGGGRMIVDEEQKMVQLYGSSGSFGKVHEEYYEAMRYILSSKYPGYTIDMK